MKSFFIGNIEIKTPVIQGGMGVGISLSGLASAVANEGGVGVISCAGLGLLYPKGKGTYPEKCINGLKEEIRKHVRKQKVIIGRKRHGCFIELCGYGAHRNRGKD